MGIKLLHLFSRFKGGHGIAYSERASTIAMYRYLRIIPIEYAK